MQQARIVLQPIAPPSILGMFSFAAAAALVGAYWAGWYGSAQSYRYLFPFVGFVGGVAQFAAALWSYHSRSGLGTVVFGVWGAFWMAHALLYLMVGIHALPDPGRASQDLGFWYVILAWIGWVTVAAAVGVSWVLAAGLGAAALAVSLEAAAQLGAITELEIAAGWLLVLSALLTWYVASAVLLEATLGHAVLPLGRTGRQDESAGLGQVAQEPGVKRQ